MFKKGGIQRETDAKKVQRGLGENNSVFLEEEIRKVCLLA